MAPYSHPASEEAYVAHPIETIGGTLTVPGDKSISHRALLMGAIAKGETTISGFLRSEDCLATLAAIRSMGVTVADAGDALTISGAGPDGLQQPAGPLDLGNSGTAMRLLLGVLAAQPFSATLTGDASLLQRPMERVAGPLREMGASIDTDQGRAPLNVLGARPLRAIDYSLPVASARLKSAILLAGLWANGRTTVKSPGPSRDHTERMLETMGVAVERSAPHTVTISGPVTLTGREIAVPADFSSAAFFIVAGLLAIACMFFGWKWFSVETPAPPEIVRADILLPSGIEPVTWGGGHVAISPDGRMVAFTAADDNDEPSAPDVTSTEVTTGPPSIAPTILLRRVQRGPGSSGYLDVELDAQANDLLALATTSLVPATMTAASV